MKQTELRHMDIASLVLGVLALVIGMAAWTISFGAGWPGPESLLTLWPAYSVTIPMALVGLTLSLRTKNRKKTRYASTALIVNPAVLVIGVLLILPPLAPIILTVVYIGCWIASIPIGVLVVVVALLSMIRERCPKCRRFEGKEVNAEKIPGTEHVLGYDPTALRITDHVAKYSVSYVCQVCGHRWSKVKTRGA